MPRPCQERHPTPQPAECYLCNLFVTRPDYNLLWGGDGKVEQAPGILRKAANFAKALAQHAAGGFKAATPEEVARRLEICKGCPAFKDGECVKCGCAMRRKAPWHSARCPLKKW